MRPAGLRAIITGSVIHIGVFSFALNALLLVTPLYMLQIYDRVIPSSSRETLFYLSLIAILSLAFLGFLDIIRALYAERVAAKLDSRLVSRAFVASVAGRRGGPGDIGPLRDLATVRTFIGSRSFSSLFDLPFAPLFVLLLYFVHPVLCLLTLCGMLLMILLAGLNQLANGRSETRAAELFVAGDATAQAFSRNADTLFAMGMVRGATEAWGRSFAEALRVQARSLAVNAVFGGIARAFRMMLQLAILGLGAWLVLKGEMTAGMIFAASIISGRALQPIDQLIGGWRQTVQAGRAWRHLQAALQRHSGGVEKIRLPEPRGMIDVKNLVYFAPNAQPGAEPIIRQVSFHIDAGEAVAIIGPSRAGKSTLARLLVGAALPSGGSIRIDGAELKSWDGEQIGRAIGYLAQDVELMPGTIAANVSRFDPQADDGKIIEAARRAKAHGIILAQHNGYQTEIGTSVATLSGGERQRIGLARAFFGDPCILVLDEPNAHLDSEGEAALLQALSDARRRKTTLIIITHNMKLAASCDRVMVLKNGAIEAFGPNADVLGKLMRASEPRHSAASFVPVMRARQRT
ncbi:ABC transporter [Paramesorhizobium deserti]|uniref:ABC transporter n=1 Tax=Paramesorhizobium deserti TaxID=1494590 RepID=A0A135HTI4_9HYPH|nr:type I secretion system permease/ATPase [Paramesorhizobium deserti]KXF76511.1 ABC transporter [Paramesorhizobium deserti]